MGDTLGYLVDHTTIQFDVIAIIALVILIAVIVYFIVMHNKRKKELDQLEKTISEKYDALNLPGTGGGAVQS